MRYENPNVSEMQGTPMVGETVVNREDLVLVTGASGFVGSKVVKALLNSGFKNIRCFVRASSNLLELNKLIADSHNASIDFFKGNLLSREDCAKATKGAKVVYHLAAGIEKTVPGAFMNTVVATRNLLEATIAEGDLLRFVNVSSFAVYSNFRMRAGSVLDENAPLENNFKERAEAYCYAKRKQDEIVLAYAQEKKLPYVIVRPGVVFGPGKAAISGRIGVDTFGFFMHLGNSNRIPFTYVDNCAEAIVLAGIVAGVGGEVFNIVDDYQPRSSEFLAQYKKHVKEFKSISIPYQLFYLFCWLWELYSKFSKGQLPPAFNRRKCAYLWKSNKYCNNKAKKMLGWEPRINYKDASMLFFQFCRDTGGNR